MRICQVVDALDYGDAVSTHIIEYSQTLNRLGIDNSIYSLYTHEKVASVRVPVDDLRCSPQDLIIYHFSGKSKLDKIVRKAECKKVLYYHNITPAEFFVGMPRHFEHCHEGRKQLKEFGGQFDLYVGVSDFNTDELRSLGFGPCCTFPIFINVHNKTRNRAFSKKGRRFLFVGRVAPNKRHEDIIAVFNYYFTYIDPQSTLFLVGNYADYDTYLTKLRDMVTSLPCHGNVIFTGKVSEKELSFYYENADVFLCLSEHEGFCVPLIESMSYGIPTFAYSGGAIKTTLGGAGVLLHDKTPGEVAELIDIIISDETMLKSLTDAQHEHVRDFAEDRRIDQVRKLIGMVEPR